MAKDITERLPALQNCAGYQAFVEDIERCKNALSMCGLCQIRAEVWFEKLGQLCGDELHTSVSKYQKGWLDPFAGY